MKTLLYTFWAIFFVGVTTFPRGQKTPVPVPPRAKPDNAGRFMDSLAKEARLDAGVLKLRQEISISEIRLKNLQMELLQKKSKIDSICVDPGIIGRTNHSQ